MCPSKSGTDLFKSRDRRSERGISPHTWTHSNIAVMKKQMQRLGIVFDWDKVKDHATYYDWFTLRAHSGLNQ